MKMTRFTLCQLVLILKRYGKSLHFEIQEYKKVENIYLISDGVYLYEMIM